MNESSKRDEHQIICTEVQDHEDFLNPDHRALLLFGHSCTKDSKSYKRTTTISCVVCDTLRIVLYIRVPNDVNL